MRGPISAILGGIAGLYATAKGVEAVTKGADTQGGSEESVSSEGEGDD